MAFSNLEKAMALIIGLDIAAPGFSRSAAKAAVRAIAPLATRAIPAAARYSPTAFGTGLGLAALETQPGQQLLESAAESGRRDRIALENAIAQLTRVTIPKAKKRTSSKFNKMVKLGMVLVKSSSSYGKKNTISNSKKAFTLVTKTASKILKGGKTAKSGITRKLGLAMRKLT